MLLSQSLSVVLLLLSSTFLIGSSQEQSSDLDEDEGTSSTTLHTELPITAIPTTYSILEEETEAQTSMVPMTSTVLPSEIPQLTGIPSANITGSLNATGTARVSQIHKCRLVFRQLSPTNADNDEGLLFEPLDLSRDLLTECIRILETLSQKPTDEKSEEFAKELQALGSLKSLSSEGETQEALLKLLGIVKLLIQRPSTTTGAAPKEIAAELSEATYRECADLYGTLESNAALGTDVVDLARVNRTLFDAEVIPHCVFVLNSTDLLHSQLF